MQNAFPTARRGYNRSEVDKFLAQARQAYEADGNVDLSESQVRAVGFNLESGGYEMSAVDEVLDRLEVGFIHRRRSQIIASQGEDAWLQEVANYASSLYPRMNRAAGERFVSPRRGQTGYLKADVDVLLDDLGRYFDGEIEMSSTQVRRVVFRSATGDNAYDMAVVDSYLDRAGEVLLSVE